MFVQQCSTCRHLADISWTAHIGRCERKKIEYNDVFDCTMYFLGAEKECSDRK